MTILLANQNDWHNEITQKYQLCIIDQWGVLHNGAKPYPYAVKMLQCLHDNKVPVVILSNSGKLSEYSHKLIASMGFNMNAIQSVISSGQAARTWLQKTLQNNKSFGKNLVFWGFDYDYTAIDGLGLQVINDIHQADFIVAAGAMRANLAAYEDELQIGAKKQIPMLCTNPDLVSNMPDGTLKICPGVMAQRYEELGGKVYRFGKPAREVYELCMEFAPDAKKIIGIGDSLEHDIKGAQDFNIDSIFITGGIHEIDLGQNPSAKQISNLAKKFHCQSPTFASRFFGGAD